MRSTFLTTLRTLVRTPSVIIWMLVFPLIMSTVFLFMFSGLRTDGTLDAVPVAVVADQAWEGSAFSQVVDALDAGLGADGEQGATAAAEDAGAALLAVTEVASEAEAQDLLAAGEVYGYWRVSADGTPALTVGSAYSWSSSDGAAAVNQSILESVTSSYVSRAALLASIASEDPAALADPQATADALGLAASVERVRLTHGVPDESVRYHYALLGMAALMASQGGLIAVTSAQPGVSAVGARRAVSGTSRTRQLVGCVLGAWVLAFACLAAAFCFLRWVVGVDFAGREGLCLVGVAGASLLSTALGALFGAAPMRAEPGGRAGMLTGITCLLSLFAGLYGQAAMQIADDLARAQPWTSWANPVKLICDLFYALYYYDSLAPFALRMAACALIAAALLLVTSVCFRRQRYEHL